MRPNLISLKEHKGIRDVSLKFLREKSSNKRKYIIFFKK